MTSAVVVALVTITAAITLVVLRPEGRPRWLLLVVPAAFALTAVPFLADGHVGLLGMGLNNDTSTHLTWIESLRSEFMRSQFAPGSYPLGPHKLVVTVAEGLGVDADRALTGLLIAIPVLTALTAVQGLAAATALIRVSAALVVAFGYLLAAYFGQGAFKETMLALFVLAAAVVLEQLLDTPRPRRAGAVPLGFIVGAALLTYSYVALAWFGALGVLLVVLWLARDRPSRHVLATTLRVAAPMALIAAAAALVATAVDLRRTLTFFESVGVSAAQSNGAIPKDELGNLAQPLPLREAFGIWPSADVRFPPPAETFMFGPLRWLLIAAVVYGVVVLFRRREFALPAALGAAFAVFLVTRDRESPYVVAKALVVITPLFLIVALRGLTVRPLSGPSTGYGARIALALVIGVAALQSSVWVLRGSPVESVEQRDQLAELRPLLHGRPTLFLGIDDFGAWRLRNVPIGMFAVAMGSSVPFDGNPKKPWTFGQPADFDSVRSADLDRFRFAIAPRAAYGSKPPRNFRVVRTTSLFALWERTGPTPRGRRVAERSGSPTGVLRCTRTTKAGTADVPVRAPVLIPPPPVLAPGASATVTLDLPAGTWDLSVQYLARIPARLQIGARRVGYLPANTTRQGPYWPMARIRSTGEPIGLLVIAERQSRLTSPNDVVEITSIAATDARGQRTVPLREACGRAVDSYDPTADGS